MVRRFTNEHVEQWREEGFAIVENFFSRDEYEPVLRDFEQLYRDAGKGPTVGEAMHQPRVDGSPSNRLMQFKNIDVFPFHASSAINLLPLHPRLIAIAQTLLETSDVHLYQCHTWAKYTGEADYDQDFHCDFGNHTLAVPADSARLRTVDFVIYFTDVTEAHGALRYVTKSDVLAALGRPAVRLRGDDQPLLRAKERAVTVPAGSILAHGIDTVHRGSNLTAPNAHRFSMTVGYKAAGNDLIGFHVWQARGNRPWDVVFNQATPVQLSCLGIPKPGDPFWSERTLELAQARWPGWDMREYFAAFQDSGV